MKDDVEGLRRLIKLQKKETGGNMKTEKSTSLGAKDLMERYGIKSTADNKAALQNQLSALYYAISSQTNQDISWGDAQKIIEDITSRIVKNGNSTIFGAES